MNWKYLGLGVIFMINTGHALATDKSNAEERNFYEVLDDVVGDFEHDLKNGEIGGLKDVAIRNIALSENVPPSFKSHIELLVTEKILKTTKTRVLQCLPCKAKRTTLDGDQVVISSPDTNPAELSRIAKTTGIQNFMDVAFAYQQSGMVLSMYNTDAETGAVIWSRSYNSETSRAAAFRRGADYSQMEEARKQTEYIPAIQFRTTVYYLNEPNLTERTSCLSVGIRTVERYDNRKKEVGFELNYLMATSVLVGAQTSATNLYSGFNLTLLFIHAWNLIGTEENFNRPRGSIFGGIGGTYVSGFLGGLIRSGYEWRLGKRSAITATVGYRPQSTAFAAGGTAAGTISGIEGGVGVSLLF